MAAEITAQSRLFLLPFRKLLLMFAGLFLLYAIGISVRSDHGIRVAITNSSKSTLDNVTLKLETESQYSLGEIKAGKRNRVFVQPGSKSAIYLRFEDSNGLHRAATIAGYVESGYCGEISVRVTDQDIQSEDRSFSAINWKSWFGFL